MIEQALRIKAIGVRAVTPLLQIGEENRLHSGNSNPTNSGPKVNPYLDQKPFIGRSIHRRAFRCGGDFGGFAVARGMAKLVSLTSKGFLKSRGLAVPDVTKAVSWLCCANCNQRRILRRFPGGEIEMDFKEDILYRLYGMDRVSSLIGQVAGIMLSIPRIVCVRSGEQSELGELARKKKGEVSLRSK